MSMSVKPTEDGGVKVSIRTNRLNGEMLLKPGTTGSGLIIGPGEEIAGSWVLSTKKIPSPADTPCLRLGRKIGRVKCKKCGGMKEDDLFSCEKHGSCTVNIKIHQTATCGSCVDYNPVADRERTPDDGAENVARKL